MEIEKSLRYRVKTSISTKGLIQWENTVDGEGFTMDEVLAESDKLVAKLKTRYPIEVRE